MLSGAQLCLEIVTQNNPPWRLLQQNNDVFKFVTAEQLCLGVYSQQELFPDKMFSVSVFARKRKLLMTASASVLRRGRQHSLLPTAPRKQSGRRVFVSLTTSYPLVPRRLRITCIHEGRSLDACCAHDFVFVKPTSFLVGTMPETFDLSMEPRAVVPVHVLSAV